MTANSAGIVVVRCRKSFDQLPEGSTVSVSQRMADVLHEKKTADTQEYIPRLARGSRALFIREDHPKKGERRTVLDPLPNPSQRSINQWYDALRRWQIEPVSRKGSTAGGQERLAREAQS